MKLISGDNRTHGGYPLFAIYTVRDGEVSLYKRDLRADFVIKLARTVWKHLQPLDEVWCVNQKTGVRRDIISR